MSIVVYGAQAVSTGEDEVFFATRAEAQEHAKEASFGCKAEVIRYVPHVGLKPIDRMLALLNQRGWYMLALTMDVYENGIRRENATKK